METVRIYQKQVILFQTNKDTITHQFQFPEKKIRSLTKLTEALKQEKEYFIENLPVQEEATDTLAKEAARLRTQKERDKLHISVLLKRVPK